MGRGTSCDRDPQARRCRRSSGKCQSLPEGRLVLGRNTSKNRLRKYWTVRTVATSFILLVPVFLLKCFQYQRYCSTPKKTGSPASQLVSKPAEFVSGTARESVSASRLKPDQTKLTKQLSNCLPVSRYGSHLGLTGKPHAPDELEFLKYTRCRMKGSEQHTKLYRTQRRMEREKERERERESARGRERQREEY